MRYFSDAPPGTVQRMLYETKIQNLPARVRGLNDAEAIKLMASGKLPAKTGSRNKKNYALGCVRPCQSCKPVHAT